jgi:ribosomal protein S19
MNRQNQQNRPHARTAAQREQENVDKWGQRVVRKMSRLCTQAPSFVGLLRRVHRNSRVNHRVFSFLHIDYSYFDPAKNEHNGQY